MPNTEVELRELAFRSQEISKTLIQIVFELKGLKEAIVSAQSSKPLSAAERHVRQLEELNSKLANRIDELEGVRA